MRLIDVSKLVYRVAVDDNDGQIFYVPAEEIDNALTIDAEPVRHGHWIETIEDGKMKRVTSCCGDDQTKLTVWYKPDYCPHCGAKMDEVTEAEDGYR